MLSPKQSMYSEKSNSPSTEYLAVLQTELVLDVIPLNLLLQIGNGQISMIEPFQCSSANANVISESIQKNVVVDSIKCSTKIQ